jgi:hypothetical protein
MYVNRVYTTALELQMEGKNLKDKPHLDGSSTHLISVKSTVNVTHHVLYILALD